MNLEEAADNSQVMVCRDITRVGLLDDECEIGKLKKLTKVLEDLKIVLQACGHRLRMHK